MPGGPRGALVDEVNGDSICDQIPLPHGHGSVNFRFSMIPSSLKFQVSPAHRLRRIVQERNSSSHKSLKRERGVGDLRDASPKGPLTGEGPGHSERADNSKISQIPNPSLALQASMVFAFIGSLDLRLFVEVSGQSYSPRILTAVPPMI